MSILSNLFSQETTISGKLDKIGYFDLITDTIKKELIKKKIDLEFDNDDNPYIGKEWLIIPNDYYISSVNDLEENNNGSSTSDFRAFEVWGSSLFQGEFQDYLKSASVVFQKNGLKLEWKDEIFDENTTERIHHRITVNEKEYIIYSGAVSRDLLGKVMYAYLNSFKDILNDVIQRQKSDLKVVILTQPECVMFVLLSPDKLNGFKKIISGTKNKLEE
ncbi:hypothetical protein [Flagellimonas myxillae]|uniref:hypothetical protein n=1 Tax=Flagellimonas myxillae TaxID=2942214 RepID=UPI00201F876C|nr:hypothetical protein [Muricauda myxillae]MCL6266515.1 hypothetical protein [Muricauda myxillae]